MNATRRSLGRLLPLLLVAALASLPASNVSGNEPSDPKPDEPTSTRPSGEAADSNRQTVLYYMHGARRCKTCRSIEAYAKGVVNTRFTEEVDTGALTWEVVDFDKPENRHFVEDFGLFTSSLVVVELDQGEVVEFEVLHEAWSLVSDKTRFQQYVYRAVREHLG